MYGWNLCPDTVTVAEEAYKEPRKLANKAMVTTSHTTTLHVVNSLKTNNELSRIVPWLKRADSPTAKKKNLRCMIEAWNLMMN